MIPVLGGPRDGDEIPVTEIGCARQIGFVNGEVIWVYELDESTEFAEQDGELQPVRKLAYHYQGSLRPWDDMEVEDEGHGSS